MIVLLSTWRAEDPRPVRSYILRRLAQDRAYRRSEHRPSDPAQTFSFARSRNTNFWILPVEVFGSGPNSTVRGALKPPRCSRQKAMISSALAAASGFRVTKAHGASPHIRAGRAATAASRTARGR